MLPVDVPNSQFHFCAGDAAEWSGIKRCGGAMNGGYCIAMNIHQKTIENSIGREPQYKELVYIAPMIAMAVGNNAVASNPDSTRSGPEVLKKYFGTDLYLSGQLACLLLFLGQAMLITSDRLLEVAWTRYSRGGKEVSGNFVTSSTEQCTYPLWTTDRLEEAMESYHQDQSRSTERARCG